MKPELTNKEDDQLFDLLQNYLNNVSPKERRLIKADITHLISIIMQRAVEEETASLRAELERLKGLLRELTMRTQSAFPENEQDNEWFDSELKGSSPKFMIDLFDALQLGRDAHRPPMGEG